MTPTQGEPKIFKPQFYEWSGSPLEIGRQHGQTLRAEIIDEYNRSLGRLCTESGLSEARFLERHRAQYEPVWQDLVPRAIEEIKGLAQGAEISYGHAFFAATRDGARVPAAERVGCTAFYAGQGTTVSGGTYLGQTKDPGCFLSRYRIMNLHYDDGLSTLILNYPGWMAHVGISSHGVVNTGNSLYAQQSPGETIPSALLKRLAMEKKSLGEVMHAVEGLPFDNGCFCLADRSGAAVCLEWIAGSCGRIDISGQAFGHANRILTPELQEYEDAPDGSNFDLDTSVKRQHNVQRLLDEKCGAIDMQYLKSIACDHTDSPQSICRHEEHGQGKTTAAFIADLDKGLAQICIGRPCEAEWLEYSVTSS